MKNAARSFLGKSTPINAASARVVDGKLILSYPDAITPVVWQMDLSTARASALEVRENEKGHFIVTLKTMKGESADIAPFETKEAAVDALMAASRALENAHGQIRTGGESISSTAPAASTVTTTQKKSGRSSKWAAGFLAFLLILFLISVWGSIAPRAPMSVENAAGGPAASSPTGANSNEAGVPLSADEFLIQQQ